MFGKPELARLLEYTAWANHRVVRTSATLSLEDFRRDLRSSHGGVRGTLAHILFAEWLWLERWKGNSPTSVIDEGEFADVMALRERWGVIEEHRQSWLESLHDDDPARAIAYRSLQGEPFEAPLWQLVQHVANHSTYHRGQLVTLLRQLGAPVVSTDMSLWDRERLARQRERGPAS
jgi:uncharacterized damage-inducible protein DinB